MNAVADPGAGAGAPVLLQAHGLRRTYSVARSPLARPAIVVALAEASFTLAAGETLAVVGESGSGKSTLARLLTMIEPPSAGRLCIDGADVAAADVALRRRLRREVQIVFQNPYGALNPRQTVGAALEEPLAVGTALPRAQRRERAHDMLARVGLRSEHYGRYPHMFSGGQRQRIAIARALMPQPRIVVLDEPVSALDVSIRAQVLNLLAELQEQLGLAYVFISHDLSVVRHIADRVLVLYLGRVVEQGSRDDVFGRPRHPYTRALLAATPVADPAARRERTVLRGEPPSPFAPPAGCVFHPRCPLAEPRCREAAPPLDGPAQHQAACWVVPPSACEAPTSPAAASD